METRICRRAVCRTTFQTTDRRKVYCKRLCKQKDCTDRWRENHPDGRKELTRRFESRHPHRKASYALLNKYGLTMRDKENILAAQGGRCANPGCRATDPGKAGFRKGWHIDHDHKTEAVRGVLCQRCNNALGLLRDDINKIRGFIEYLSAPPIHVGKSVRSQTPHP